jgi:membrane protein DedA with SNARE-associated domain
MQLFIEQYGYIFVFLGTLFGGETVLAMAGFVAHRGYLLLPWVIVIGWAGNFTDTLIWFLLGRYFGNAVIRRYPAWQPRIDKMDNWLIRYRAPAVIGVRFFAGFRTPANLAIGMSDIPLLSFLLLNLVGAFLWAVVIATVGYFFGTAVKALMGDLKDLELLLVALMGVMGVAGWLYLRWRHRRQAVVP